MHFFLTAEKGLDKACFIPVNFKLWDGGQINTIQETRDLGLMLYDMDYSVKGDIEPMFFHAKLENGMLNVPLPDSEEVLR